MRSLRSALLLVAAMGGTAIAASESAKSKAAKAHYEEGLKRYNLGEFKAALDAFKAGYLEKADPVFLFNLGQCYRKLGDAENAIQEYAAYLRERPDAPNREDVVRVVAELKQAIKSKEAGIAAAPASALAA